MKVTISPSRAVGVVKAPPSKSVAHRALICGALTSGCSIEHCGASQDIEATLRCLMALGAKIERVGDTVHIGQLNPYQIPNNATLDCGESGSTLRFMLPLCLLSGKSVNLTGHGRLMERPMEIYEMLCKKYGFYYKKTEHAITVAGNLKCGHYSIPGNVSSQFITGLLFALSCIPGESHVEVTGSFESASYVDITLAVLSNFGVSIKRCHNAFHIIGGRTIHNSNYIVEGDCSNAAFLDAFNLLGGDVKVLGLSPKTPQGDWVYHNMYTDLQNQTRDFDLSDCPDLGPVMFALSAALGGAKFTGTARLRIKESDRIASMAEELNKFGINLQIEDDAVTVLPGILTAPSKELCSHNDHRIVMALSLLCSITGGTINGAEAVAKSFPNYFDVVRSLGIEVYNHDIQ